MEIVTCSAKDDSEEEITAHFAILANKIKCQQGSQELKKKLDQEFKSHEFATLNECISVYMKKFESIVAGDSVEYDQLELCFAIGYQYAVSDASKPS